jgi:hypothetical protein
MTCRVHVGGGYYYAKQLLDELSARNDDNEVMRLLQLLYMQATSVCAARTSISCHCMPSEIHHQQCPHYRIIAHPLISPSQSLAALLPLVHPLRQLGQAFLQCD